MNFKDAYKNMQNDIEPKREILNNLSYEEDKKTTSFKTNRFRHSFALMLIMVIAFSFVYFSNTQNQIDTKTPKTNSDNKTDICDITTQISPINKSRSIDNDSLNPSTNTITYDNYASYLGFDILSRMVIPNDLVKNETKLNYALENSDDRGFFNFANHDGTRYINIITTKLDVYNENYADYNLYKKDDLNIFVFFEGFTKEEINSFENSIK